jgi:hypothetical protein
VRPVQQTTHLDYEVTKASRRVNWFTVGLAILLSLLTSLQLSAQIAPLPAGRTFTSPVGTPVDFYINGHLVQADGTTQGDWLPSVFSNTGISVRGAYALHNLDGFNAIDKVFSNPYSGMTILIRGSGR